MNVPPIAAALYGAAVAADVAIDRGRDPLPAILTAKVLLEAHEAEHGAMPPGPGRVYVSWTRRLPCVRAWSRLDPTLTPEAERIEAARDLDMVTMPGLDA